MNTTSNSPPSTPHSRKHLTRDQRLRIHTLRDHGLSQLAIARELGVTRRQVQYTLEKEVLTPSRRLGRPSVLSSGQVDELEAFVTSSSAGRQMSYFELARVQFRHWNVSESAIKRVLKERGYERRIARSKPPLSAEHMRARKQWAEEHMSWSLEQWSQILWTDETWVNGLRHSRVWVTRKRDETHLPDCVTAKVRKGTGWMFWGSFNGNEKGPCLFWEKDRGSISAKKYCRYIAPRIVGKLELNPALQLMQDRAPAHTAQKTRDELSR